MSAEVLIYIVCKNDGARVFFRYSLFFYNKEICKHIVIISILRRAKKISFCFLVFQFYSYLDNYGYQKEAEQSKNKALYKLTRL